VNLSFIFKTKALGLIGWMGMNDVRKSVGGRVGSQRGSTNSKVVYCHLLKLLSSLGCQLKTGRACQRFIFLCD